MSEKSAAWRDRGWNRRPARRCVAVEHRSDQGRMEQVAQQPARKPYNGSPHRTWLWMPLPLLLMGVLSVEAQPVRSIEALQVEPVSLSSDPVDTPPSPVQIHSSYTLGPNDGVRVWVIESNEIPTEPLRIESSGYINVPMAGRFRAAGLTTEELEAEITQRLRRVVRDPTVSVTVTEFQSRPVSVLGAVNQPGVQQLRGPKTLLEVLSLAGGLRRDAGQGVKGRRTLWYGARSSGGVRIRLCDE